MAADQDLPDDQLPAGHIPIWIKPPCGATQVEMLERVETMVVQYQDVMVLYNGHLNTDGVTVWCKERGWRHCSAGNVYGCEAQCVVLLECGPYPEYITRARNMLIIVER